jgi:hypothetical protein
MANKNRKKRVGGFVFPLPVAGILMSLVVMLLLYVWLDARVQALGARLKNLEQQQAEINKRYDIELWKWETLKTPAGIEKMLAQNKSVMIWPAEANIIRLKEPEAGVELKPPAEGQMAQLSRRSRSVAND